MNVDVRLLILSLKSKYPFIYVMKNFLMENPIQKTYALFAGTVDILNR